MFVLPNGSTFIILCISILIHPCLFHFSPSLGEAFATSKDYCVLSEFFQCKSNTNVGSKQDSECSRWLKRTASILGMDIPLSIVSVVVVSHNEKINILKDTIKSLLANTSCTLLKEIIIVDDYSQPPIDLSFSTFKVQVNVVLRA